MLGRRFYLFLVLMLVVVAGAARGQQQSPDPRAGMQGVVYDPAAKSYFALIYVPRTAKGTAEWDAALQLARGMAYKGVQGRLAIVDSLETHEFLLQHFRPMHDQYVWIGLRYLCRARQLETSTGQIVKPGSFQAFDKDWNQDKTAVCKDPNNPNDWASIAYSPQDTWIVKGAHKGYEWFYVEFPTGHP